jgi:hypothetical protein
MSCDLAAKRCALLYGIAESFRSSESIKSSLLIFHVKYTANADEEDKEDED